MTKAGVLAILLARLLQSISQVAMVAMSAQGTAGPEIDQTLSPPWVLKIVGHSFSRISPLFAFEMLPIPVPLLEHCAG